MLVGAASVEVFFNLAILTATWQLRTWLRELSSDADRQLESLETTLDSNRYLLEMIFGTVVDHQTIATATAGYCPGR